MSGSCAVLDSPVMAERLQNHVRRRSALPLPLPQVCSLYDEDACPAGRACEFSRKRCSGAKFGASSCETVCKRVTAQGMRQITFGAENLMLCKRCIIIIMGWETGGKRRPAVIVLQEWWYGARPYLKLGLLAAACALTLELHSARARQRVRLPLSGAAAHALPVCLQGRERGN